MTRTSTAHRSFRAVLTAVVLLGGGAVLVQRGQLALADLDHPSPAGAAAVWPAAPPAPPPPALPPPALPLVDTADLPPQPDQPIDIPSNPYAPERVIEIGTIEIPKIGLTHRVFHGVTLRSIDNGPSHWPGTAFPGQRGNSVFAGHRVTHSHPFRNIDRLVEGDQVIFTVAGVRTVYAVTGHEVVPPSAVHIADPTPTPTATLYACHPPGSARYRYVVHLALVPA